MTTLSVVVPVYNSEQSLPELAAELGRTLPALTSDFELILVNDGSRDRSWEVINQLRAQYPWIRGFDLARNYGQHNALLCGIRAARNAVIVIMDDDLQHPPEELPKLLEKLDQGYDVVYGTPEHETHGLMRDFASVFTKFALRRSMGVDVATKVTSFFVFRTRVRDAFRDYRGTFVSIDVLLTWGTTRFGSVTVRHDERKFGASNYTLSRLITYAVNMITGYSTVPLQLASLIGFVFTVFGFLVLVYVLIEYLIQGGDVPGFAFLASIIALFSGAQLFALGIIGEYLARVHVRTMDHPAYVVREELDDSAGNTTSLPAADQPGREA